MSKVEFISEVPITAQDIGAEARRRALFLAARDNGSALCGVDAGMIAMVLDHHMETDDFWARYVDEVFERVEREANLRGESWEWRDA
jgi:hypothetical protein